MVGHIRHLFCYVGVRLGKIGLKKLHYFSKILNLLVAPAFSKLVYENLAVLSRNLIANSHAVLVNTMKTTKITFVPRLQTRSEIQV